MRSFRQANGRASRAIDYCSTMVRLEHVGTPTVIFTASPFPEQPINWVLHADKLFRPILTNHSCPMEIDLAASLGLDDIIIRQSMNGRSEREIWDAPHPDYPFSLDLSRHAATDPWHRARSPGPLRKNGYWPTEIGATTARPMDMLEIDDVVYRPSNDLGWIVHFGERGLTVTPWTGFEPAWVGPGVVFPATEREAMDRTVSAMGGAAAPCQHVDAIDLAGLPFDMFNCAASADLATLRLVMHAVAAYHAPDLSDLRVDLAAWYWQGRAFLEGQSYRNVHGILLEAETLLAAVPKLRELSYLLKHRNGELRYDPELELFLQANIRY